jgi:hypothetical protein
MYEEHQTHQEEPINLTRTKAKFEAVTANLLVGDPVLSGFKFDSDGKMV